MGLPPTDAAATSPGGTQWLDIRVIYVRVSAPAVSYAEAPEKLVLRCGPRDTRSEMEMNGARIPPSEMATLSLRLDRIDEDASEAMYVSTDKLRLSCGMPFAVFQMDEQLAGGLISCRESLSPWPVGVENSEISVASSLDWPSELSSHSSEVVSSRVAEWGMKIACTVSSAWTGFTIKSLQDLTTAQPVQPSLEVCVVGKCCGSSIMLTDQVQLLPRKRGQWKGGLDVIPETEESGRGLHLVGPRSGNFEAQGQLEEFRGQGDGRQVRGERAVQRQGVFLEGLWPTEGTLNHLYGDLDNGETTWFNAGVRVGVGIGLGMCIGMGIGVGLLVKTYQASTRPFRRARFL